MTHQPDSKTSDAVKLEGVGKTYQRGRPVEALVDVSFSLPRRSHTSIMGPSGSGKSTLLHLIGCLDTTTEGTIQINDQNVSELGNRGQTNLRGQEIGFVFQTFNLVSRLTAVDNVALPMVFQNVPRRKRMKRAERLLKLVDLETRMQHKPSELSGGQRQRVAIARALANDPTLILADEPTGSLDSETEAKIMELLVELNEQGNTILVVTHDRHVAEYGNQIIHLFDGAIKDTEIVDHSKDSNGTN